MIRKIYRAFVKRQSGFSLFELVIVIVLIGILAAAVAISYAGIQSRVHNLKRRSDISSVQERLEVYAARNGGKYPITSTHQSDNWRTIDVLRDSNCFNGPADIEWVPDFKNLPQSVTNTGAETGADGKSGCYLYVSNGEEYVLSAWNMVSKPTTEKSFYRRLGFRPFQTPTSTQFYTCNENEVGGKKGKNYDIDADYYKHSYTVSNITDCDETPPAGA